MTGRQAVKRAMLFQLVERQVVSAEVEGRVQQRRTMAGRLDVTVAVRPGRIGRVVSQEPRPKDCGDIGHAHRHSRMAAGGRLDRVHGEAADDVGAQSIDARRACIIASHEGLLAPMFESAARFWRRRHCDRLTRPRVSGVVIGSAALPRFGCQSPWRFVSTRHYSPWPGSATVPVMRPS